MTIVAVRERELQIADDVRAAVSLLKTRYQAVLTHDSGHTDTGPTWIFTLPKPKTNFSWNLQLRPQRPDFYYYPAFTANYVATENSCGWRVVG